METEKRVYRLKPNFGDSYGTGWNVMMDNFLRLFLVIVILGVITVPLNLLQVHVDPFEFDWHNWDMGKLFRLSTFGIFAAFYGILSLLYAFLVIPVFRYGGKMMFVQAARSEKLDFEMLIRGFRENYLSIILANLLAGALIALGLFALIVPGIIIACRLAFVSYLVMDKKLDPIEAVETSWRLTRGHGWTIFLMGFVAFFIYIFGAMLLLVGIFPAIMWVSSSFAALYQSVLLEKENPAETAAAA